jgi:hypothetical protein
LTEKVDNDRLFKLLKFAIETDSSYIRLHAAPGGNGQKIQITDNVSVTEILPGTRWRTSLVPAIWDVETFKSLLNNQTPWEFEHFIVWIVLMARETLSK